MVGKTVQQYQFLEKLGAGGMGEIYKAQDTRLNRFVAIKVLTAATSGDPSRRKRFILEAQSASALNHPNIITIHDIISENDADYMVMEHVIGKTLGELIPRGGLRVPQVLKIGLQITDALNAAHLAGIVHRDLKPGNIMVTDAGLVKVLDFGLAKLTDMSPITGTGPEDATQTIGDRSLTMEGSIIGTVSYMSPEQAQGRKVDSRSDIFSLGSVFYEMLTGTRAFQGDSALVTLSGILRDEPRAMQEIVPDVPGPMEQMVWRCLRKLPDDRFQTMKDVHMSMGGLKSESDSGILYRSAMLTALPSLSSSGSSLTPLRGSPPTGSTAAASSAGSAISGSASVLSQTAQATAAQTAAQIPPASPAKSNSAWLGIALVLAAGLGAGAWFLSRKPPIPQPPILVTAAPAAAPAAVKDNATLTNANIIEMIDAKVPLPTIYSQMRADKTAFDTSVQGVIQLTKAHVPSEVIDAMRHPQNAANLAGSVAGDLAKGATDPNAKGTDKTVVPTGGKQVVLPNGSPFSVTLAADIPDSAEQGKALRFTVTNDVRVGDSVVIAKGAPVVGEIAQGSKKRLFGGARMTMRLSTVEAVDGRKYSVRAIATRGSDGKAERRVETNTKPTSENAAASAGTEYIAFADGDLLISVKK